MLDKCYCKSGLLFSECCEPILRVEKIPTNALALMRSRYSAYCVGDVNYLQATTYDHTWSDEELKFIQDWADNSFWQHLEIIDFNNDDIVEFKAYYIYDHVQHVHHERSTFAKINDMYKYVDGEIFEDKVSFGNNEKCICGSGLKYKRCCLPRLKK
jgi:SEC-C motif-containing protein